jgi:hypothetical protein
LVLAEEGDEVDEADGADGFDEVGEIDEIEGADEPAGAWKEELEAVIQEEGFDEALVGFAV